MNQFTGNPLRQKLAGARQWWRTTRSLSALAWTVGITIVLALICYHSDRALALSPAGRQAWKVIIPLAGAGVLIFGLLRAMFRPLPDALLAAAVERRYPTLRERLLTTVDLIPAMATAEGVGGSGFSRAMTHSLAEETQQTASSMNFRRAVNLRPTRNALLVALVTLCMLVGDYALSPSAFANWLQRMQNPTADIAPWANTMVWIKPDAEILARGEGTSVTILAKGTLASLATLRYRPAGDANAPWKTLNLDKPKITSETGPSLNQDAHATSLAYLPGANAPRTQSVSRFRYRFSSLPQSIVMMATANDGRSNERSVNVEDRPTLLNTVLTLHFPSYMHRPSQTTTVSGGSVAAPRGTEVDVKAIANKSLRQAEFVKDGSPVGPWKISGENAFGHLSIWKDGTYGLRLVDRHGFNNPGAPNYEIRALKDMPPSVQIQRPGTDMELVPNGSIPLVAHAADDYGVNAMNLAYDKLQGEGDNVGDARLSRTGRGAFPLPGPNGGIRADVAQRWHLASVNPRPGETVRYEVDAIDNDAVDGPHTARSNSFRIRIVTVTEMQKRLMEDLNNENRAMAELHRNQIEAQNQVEQARQKPTNANIAKAQETQRSVAQQTKAMAQRIADISAKLENNDLATQSQLNRRQDAEHLLNEDASQKMPAAADQIQKAQAPKPSDPAKTQALAQTDRKQTEIKHDIEAAQEKLSRTPTPEQLAEEIKNLAERQENEADQSRELGVDIKANQKQNPNAPLTAEEKVGLETQRQQQTQTAAETKKVEQQLRNAAQEAKERGEPEKANALNDAAKALEQGKVDSNQQQAQNNLQHNDANAAATPQEKAATALHNAADQAAKAASPKGNQATAEQLQHAADELHKLAEEQKQVADKTAASPDAQQSKDLGNKEQGIQQQAQQAQKDLAGAKQAQQSAQSGQQHAADAGKQLNQDQPKSAESPARQAQHDFEKAAKAAEQAAQNIKQDAAAKELQEKIEHLAQVQHGLENATKRLQQAGEHGPLNSNDQHELGQVAQKQTNIEAEAKDLVDRFPSPVFKQALNTAAKQMHPASQNLNQNKPDPGKQTQIAQHHAAQTLDAVAQALKQQAQGSPPPPSNQDPNSPPPPDGPTDPQANAALGELMLAQALQQQVREGTGQLDKGHPADKPLTPEQQQEAHDLAAAQQQTQDAAQHAGQQLSQLPGVQQHIQQATPHMSASQQNLNQQATGQPTQGHQDAALDHLTQATAAAKKAMDEQAAAAAAAAAAGKGMPQPGNKPGQSNDPDKKALTRLQGAQRGALSDINGKGGNFGGLGQRAQRTLREGQNEQVPAEYQDWVSRYYKSLAEKKR